MEMKTIEKVASAWGVLNDSLGLARPLRSEAEYARLAEFAESLAETLPDDADEPLWGLVGIVSDRLREYENRAHPWADLPPHELLRELMRERGIRQSELADVGAQSTVSEILSGKRALNLRQVRALARRFSLPMEAFAGGGRTPGDGAPRESAGRQKSS
jgi:HTH-type transcriptional regulator/antitoxin HigA